MGAAVLPVVPAAPTVRWRDSDPEAAFVVVVG
jgi:hypothetical protein